MNQVLKRIAIVVVAGMLTACAARTEPIRVETPLNSTLIKQKFGSYGVDVIVQETNMRVASLYSLVDGLPVTRTLAIVGYEKNHSPIVNEVHAQIRAGGSMGQSFIDHGFDVVKETVILMKLPADRGMASLYDMMSLEEQAPLAYHSYLLKVRKDSNWITYARVTEVHSPEHLTLRELARRLKENKHYPVDHPYTREILEEFREFLNQYVGPNRVQAANRA